uniref:Polyketide synthase n=1 Tax=Peronospora matthiolae TaxID=2874970 RepID=A0AAV1TN09_9STRA
MSPYTAHSILLIIPERIKANGCDSDDWVCITNLIAARSDALSAKLQPVSMVPTTNYAVSWECGSSEVSARIAYMLLRLEPNVVVFQAILGGVPKELARFSLNSSDVLTGLTRRSIGLGIRSDRHGLD